MGAAQAVLICIWVAVLTQVASEDGKLKKHPNDRHNIGLTLVRIIIVALILWWGGFWN